MPMRNYLKQKTLKTNIISLELLWGAILQRAFGVLYKKPRIYIIRYPALFTYPFFAVILNEKLVEN
jgi:hypothetical protein